MGRNIGCDRGASWGGRRALLALAIVLAGSGTSHAAITLSEVSALISVNDGGEDKSDEDFDVFDESLPGARQRTGIRTFAQRAATITSSSALVESVHNDGNRSFLNVSISVSIATTFVLTGSISATPQPAGAARGGAFVLWNLFQPGQASDVSFDTGHDRPGGTVNLETSGVLQPGVHQLRVQGHAEAFEIEDEQGDVVQLVTAQANWAFTLSLCGGAGAIVGTEDDDKLNGTPGDDVICGFGGNDIIDGGAGNDVIFGGAGNDTILGGDGNDYIEGGLGDDTIDGGTGDNEICGDVGPYLVGSLSCVGEGGGDDHITVTDPTAPNFVDGGPGDDVIEVEGVVFVSGGPGSDQILGDNIRDSLICGDVWIDGPNDALGSRCGDPSGDPDTLGTIDRDLITISSSSGVEGNTVRGGPGHDVIFCGDSADTISGEEGDDEIHGGGGADLIFGNRGQDKILGEGGDDEIHGGANHDLLSGGGGRDKLLGEGGPDEIFGGAGADILKGGPGVDELHGGGGDDRLITRDGVTETVIDGGPGNDSAKIDDGSDTPQNIETLLP